MASPLPLCERVRSRPADFLGPIDTGQALMNLLELGVEAALEVAHEVRVIRRADGALIIEDTGPALDLDSDGWLGGRAGTRVGAAPIPTGWLQSHALLLAGSERLLVRSKTGQGMTAQRGLITRREVRKPRARNQLTLRPLAAITDGPPLDATRLRRRLRTLAALSPGHRITFEDRQTKLKSEWQLAGVAELLSDFDAHQQRLHAAPVCVGVPGAELALRWSASGGTRIIGYVNRRRVVGGAHVALALAALAHAVDSHTRATGKAPLSGPKWPPQLTLGEHLTGIIHVNLEAPEFQGPHHLLSGPAVRALEVPLATRLAAALGTHGAPTLEALAGRYLERLARQAG